MVPLDSGPVNRVGDRHAGDRPGRRVRVVGVPSGPNFDGPAHDRPGAVVLHVVVEAGQPTASTTSMPARDAGAEGHGLLPLPGGRRAAARDRARPGQRLHAGLLPGARKALALASYARCTCTPLAAASSRWRSTCVSAARDATSCSPCTPRGRTSGGATACSSSWWPLCSPCSSRAVRPPQPSLPPTLKRLVRRLEVIPNGVDVERIDRVLEGARGRPRRRPGEPGSSSRWAG